MLETILQNRFAVTAVLLFGIGFMNLLLQQNLLKKVVGFNIMDSAVFMLLASLGYIEGRVAPVMGEGVTPDASLFINPIPSGLVLTGIVVSVSITAFSLALIQRIHKHYGTIEMKELLARVHAVLRRLGGDEVKARRLTFDGLVIDLDSYELEVKGKRVDTPPKELELLFHLASSPNRVFTRNQLLDEVWGFDYFGDSRTVDVHIKRLREKLEGVSDQWSLKTVWGVGYKFELHNN